MDNDVVAIPRGNYLAVLNFAKDDFYDVNLSRNSLIQCVQVYNKYIVLCTLDKKLTVFDVKEKKEVSSRILPRSVASLACSKFESNGSTIEMVIVGDNTGDVYALSLPDVSISIKNILGHTTSMITSLVVSPDGKFLVSADRDEKIRVSQFPRTSIAHSYCLGHSAHIISISIPKMSNYLVSTSGDHTLRLWNYYDGMLLYTQKLRSDMKVLKGAVCPKTNVIAVAYTSCMNIDFFKITTLGELQIHPKLSLKLQACPIDLFFDSNGRMWVIFSDYPSISVWNWVEDQDDQFLNEIVSGECIEAFRTWAKDKLLLEEENEDGRYTKKRLREANWITKLPVPRTKEFSNEK